MKIPLVDVVVAILIVVSSYDSIGALERESQRYVYCRCNENEGQDKVNQRHCLLVQSN